MGERNQVRLRDDEEESKGLFWGDESVAEGLVIGLEPSEDISTPSPYLEFKFG